MIYSGLLVLVCHLSLLHSLSQTLTPIPYIDGWQAAMTCTTWSFLIPATADFLVLCRGSVFCFGPSESRFASVTQTLGSITENCRTDLEWWTSALLANFPLILYSDHRSGRRPQ